MHACWASVRHSACPACIHSTSQVCDSDMWCLTYTCSWPLDLSNVSASGKRAARTALLALHERRPPPCSGPLQVPPLVQRLVAALRCQSPAV
eukprot:2785079-Amphidinium_carterae.1